jgi:hypothetical protein
MQELYFSPEICTRLNVRWRFIGPREELHLHFG